MEWTPEAIEQLRQWWEEEHLTLNEIARRFGTTRNSIVGKVHRLNLTKRPGILTGRVKPLEKNECAWVVRRIGPDPIYCRKKVMFNKSYCQYHIAQAWMAERFEGTNGC